jgi:GNAT superfamily N-acetyltransferase
MMIRGAAPRLDTSLHSDDLCSDGASATSTLCKQAAHNLAVASLCQASWSRSGMSVAQNGLVLTTACDRLPIAPFNAAQRTGDTPASEALAQARHWFSQRDSGFSYYVRSESDQDIEQVCRDQGLVLHADMPVMAIETSPKTRPALSDLEILAVESVEQVAQFVNIAARAFSTSGVPERAIEEAFDRLTAVLQAPVRLFLAFARGNPVGCGLLLFTEQTAGIYWLAVVPSLRGRGYATELTDHLVRYALSNGARHVILQASPSAESVYLRLGFLEISRLRCYCQPFCRNSKSSKETQSQAYASTADSGTPPS